MNSCFTVAGVAAVLFAGAALVAGVKIIQTSYVLKKIVGSPEFKFPESTLWPHIC